MPELHQRFAVTYPDGSYFASVDQPTGAALVDSLTFNTEQHARWWFGKFAPFVWENGGTLVPVMGDAAGVAHERVTP